MKQQGEKKRWIVPELLVLVRSHPEEAVLFGCKLFSGGPEGGLGVCNKSFTGTCPTPCPDLTGT